MRGFPAAITGWVVAGAACWVLSAVFFVVQAIAQAATTRPYGLAVDLISDLGATACGPSVVGVHPAVCSPLHGLANGAFVATGLLQAIGAVATRRAWPRPADPGLALLAVAGLGLALAGLSPEDVDLTRHTLAAVVGIACLTSAMAVFGVALLGVAPRLGAPALASGIVGAIAADAFLHGTPGSVPGATERVAVYPGVVMVIVLGVVLLGSAVRATRTARATSPS